MRAIPALSGMRVDSRAARVGVGSPVVCVCMCVGIYFAWGPCRLLPSVESFLVQVGPSTDRLQVLGVEHVRWGPMSPSESTPGMVRRGKPLPVPWAGWSPAELCCECAGRGVEQERVDVVVARVSRPGGMVVIGIAEQKQRC